MQYQVLESPYLQKLSEEVNSKILQGWVPLGGIGVAPVLLEGGRGYYTETTFFQAMTFGTVA